MGGGLLPVALPSLFEQFAAGLAQVGEDRSEGFQRGHHVGVAGRRRAESIGGGPMREGGLSQFIRHHGDPFRHL